MSLLLKGILIGPFGLTMVSDFLLEYQIAIHLAGGELVWNLCFYADGGMK